MNWGIGTARAQKIAHKKSKKFTRLYHLFTTLQQYSYNKTV